MRKIRFLLAVILCVSVLTAVVAGCGNQTAEPEKKVIDFPTKDITFIVPTSPGGGFDTYSRVLVNSLSKHLPKTPNIVVQNIEGSNFVEGINKIVKADPDGHTIGVFNLPGNLVTQILGQAPFDLTKIVWIGETVRIPYILCASPASGITSVEQLKNLGRKPKLVSTGISTSAGLGAQISMQEMGIEINHITGQTQQMVLSAIRGDVDLVFLGYGSLKPYIVDSNQLNPILVFSKKRLEQFPNVTTSVELGYPNLDEKLTVYHLVGATPGIPDEVAEILREAFDKAVEDPGFSEELVRIKQLVPQMHMPGKELGDFVAEQLKVYSQYKSILESASK